MIELSKIQTSSGTQSRAEINQAKVTEYADHLTNGGKFPPVVLFFDSASYWLADGWHRYHAHLKIGRKEIYEDIKIGTRRDAALYSFGANSEHGLPRTNADKRKAVNEMLSDEEWRAWSDRKIAEACRVTHTFVSNLRTPESTEKKAIKNRSKVATVATLPSEAAPVLEAENKNNGTNKTEGAETETELSTGNPPDSEPENKEGYEYNLTMMRNSVDALSEENDYLKGKIANYVAVLDDDHAGHLDRLNELTTENTRLGLLLRQMTVSRDFEMAKSADATRLNVSLSRRLKKIDKANAAKQAEVAQ